METILKRTIHLLVYFLIFCHPLLAIDNKEKLDEAYGIRKENPERAIMLLDSALTLDKISTEEKGIAYLMRGKINYYQLGDKEKALGDFYNSLRHFRNDQNQDQEYNCLVYLGLAFSNLYHYDYAIHYYQEVLQLPGLDSAKLSLTKYNLARVLTQKQDYEEAEQLLEELCNYYSETGNKKLFITAKTALAKNYFESGAYEKSENLYQEILKMAEESGDLSRQSRAINSLGYIKLKQEEYQEAEQFLIRGLAMKEQSAKQQSLLMSYLNLGELYSELGQTQKAVTYFELGSRLDIKSVNQLNLIESLNGLLRIAKEKNDLKKVVQYQDRVIEIQAPYVELSERLEILHSKYKAERMKYLNDKIELQAQLILSQNRNLIGALIFTGCLVLAFVGLYWQYRKLKIDHDLIGWLRKQSKLLFFLQRKYNIDLEQAEKELDRGAY